MKTFWLYTPVILVATLLFNTFSIAHAQNLEKLRETDRKKVERAWQVIEEFTRSDDFPEQVDPERLRKLYRETTFVRGYPPIPPLQELEGMTQSEWEQELRRLRFAASTLEGTIYIYPNTLLSNPDLVTTLIFHEMMHIYFGGHLSDGSPKAKLLLATEEWLAYDFEIQLLEWIIEENSLGLFNDFKRYRAIQRLIRQATIIRDLYFELIDELEKQIAEISSGMGGAGEIDRGGK